MKTIILLLTVLSLNCAAYAQDSWKIVHNGKEKINTNEEDETANRFSITAEDLKKSDNFLWVVYKDADKEEGWKRVIALYDEKDNEIIKHGGDLFKVYNGSLRSYIRGRKELRVFTWSLPTDPNVAATIRIRRVHLGTIEIK